MDEAQLAKVNAILSQIQAAGNALNAQEPGSRQTLLDLSYTLSSALELPSESIFRTGTAAPALSAATKTAVDLGIFDLLSKASIAAQGKRDGSISVLELSASTGADATLLSRLLKHLAAMHVVDETAVDRFRATPLSNALTEPRYRDGITHFHDVAGPVYGALPAYLAQTEYSNPSDIAKGPFQYAHKTDAPIFKWFEETNGGKYAVAFNNYMGGYRQGKPSWCEFYPVREKLLGEKGTVLVDVGGGLGHDLREFAARYEGSMFEEALVLQDRPEVVQQIDKSENHKAIKYSAHDFFTTQPVKQAKAYYLHSVLHDWDDESSIKILQHLVPAMTGRKPPSRLLINDFIVPDTHAPWPVTSMDLLVLVLGAVKERTEAQWRQILDEAGFEVTGIWQAEGGALAGTESLIEAIVKS